MFGAPVSTLRGFDEARAKAFYLGFEQRFEPGAPLYMGVCKGGCVLHLSERFGDGSPGSGLRIPVDDVSAHMAELRTKRFANAGPGEPEETPWRSREIIIHDPAGNRPTFYTEVETGDGAR